MAEERATRRFKNIKEDSLLNQRKGSYRKRQKALPQKENNKLTLSKALDEEALDGRERSLASVKRARLKEKKSQDSTKKNIRNKKNCTRSKNPR